MVLPNLRIVQQFKRGVRNGVCFRDKPVLHKEPAQFLIGHGILQHMAAFLDNYVFSPQYSSPIEVAKGELSLILCEPDAATLAPHLNLYQYGQAHHHFISIPPCWGLSSIPWTGCPASSQSPFTSVSA